MNTEWLIHIFLNSNELSLKMKELSFFSPMRKAQAKINKPPVRGWLVEVWDFADPLTSAESV